MCQTVSTEETLFSAKKFRIRRRPQVQPRQHCSFNRKLLWRQHRWRHLQHCQSGMTRLAMFEPARLLCRLRRCWLASLKTTLWRKWWPRLLWLPTYQNEITGTFTLASKSAAADLSRPFGFHEMGFFYKFCNGIFFSLQRILESQNDPPTVHTVP